MNDIMTIAEIEAQFPSEWILLDDPQVDEQQRVQSGRLLHHSPDRDEVYRKALELRPKFCAFICTKKLQPGTGYAL
ncbi:MAG: hypothetical protein K2R98_33250 [Gemmataceae bacterium]|nr:hypothetical protein [Gemmataceae bacterium]